MRLGGLKSLAAFAPFGLTLMLEMGGIGATTDARGRDVGASSSSSQTAPAVYVVDSSNALVAYDNDGTLLHRADLSKEKAVLNGGIAVATGHVYVTFIHKSDTESSTGVYAFNATTLQPTMLHKGAFKVPAESGDPGEFRGIAYDAVREHFYVASDRLGLLVFDRFGKFVARMAGAPASVGSLTYDLANQSLWLIDNRHSVASYREADTAPAASLVSSPLRGERGLAAVAVAYCGVATAAAEARDLPAAGAPAVAVVFGKLGPTTGDAHGRIRGAGGAARIYDLAGKPLAARFGGKIVNPHGIACTTKGSVLIAADNGLLAYSVQGEPLQASMNGPGLEAPILGVFSLN